MNINSPGFSKEFYTQTGDFSVRSLFTVPSYEAICEFGVSGANGLASVKLKQGKIYDNSNRFVGVYDTSNPVDLNLRVGPTKYDFLLNDTPLVFADTKFTGSSKLLFVKTTETLEELTYSIDGEVPDFHYSTDLTYNTSATQVGGTFTNDDSQPIVIYSGEYLGDSESFELVYPTGTINAGASQPFTVQIKQSGLVGPNAVESLLYTNFGKVSFNVNLEGVEPAGSTYTFTIAGNVFADLGASQDYFGTFTPSIGNFSVIPSLRHISGQQLSYTNVPTSGLYAGNATGNIVGEGYLYLPISVPATGSGGSQNNTVVHTIESVIAHYFYATGFVSGVIEVTGYGTGVGNGYSGLAYGMVSKNFSGIVHPGSGFLSIDEDIVQVPATAYSVNPTSYTPNTGLINYGNPMKSVTSDILYVGSLYHGIVYGFHYSTRETLISYLNANSGIHKVQAAATGGSGIFLQSIAAVGLDEVITKVDQDNDGTMTVAGPRLVGGSASGYGTPVTPTSSFVGRAKGKLVREGYYSVPIEGVAYSEGSVVDQSRSFGDIWDFEVGTSFDDLVSYTAKGWYHPSSGFQSPTPITGSQQNLYMRVTYRQSAPNITDIASIMLEGKDDATGVYATFRITGRNI